MARHLLRPILPSLLHRPIHRPIHRPYIAVNDNLLRILNNELTYLADYQPPLQPPSSYGRFAIEDRPGEQWVRLRGENPVKNEEIKIDATMFDGVAPVSEAKKARYEGEELLHVSLVVEVAKGEDSESVLVFVCSAWPESIEVERVFPLEKKTARVQPYMGRNFKSLSKEMQDAVLDYLVEREVDDDLAEFLHRYMTNKGKAELLRWMKHVESCIQK